MNIYFNLKSHEIWSNWAKTKLTCLSLLRLEMKSALELVCMDRLVELVAYPDDDTAELTEVTDDASEWPCEASDSIEWLGEPELEPATRKTMVRNMTNTRPIQQSQGFH